MTNQANDDIDAGLNFATEFMAVVACPACRNSLAIDYDASELVCVNADCGLAYPVRDGIPVLLVDDARRP